MARYDPRAVKEVVEGIARAAGVSAKDAEIFADSLVDADINGLSTHGVSRVNIYIRRIQAGLIDPIAGISIGRRKSGVLSVDAGNGLGQVQAFKVLDLLIHMAKESGIAAATIRNSQHFGALSYYCNRAAQQDMILLAMTAAEPSMSPEGGCEAYFGTNPIAASFPTGKPFGYIRIDLSTSLVARGNIIAAQKEGKSIPLGWALDVEGNPTTDPDAALMGTVLTMAGPKGYALALMVELFSSVLSGAAVGSSIGSMYKDMDRKQDVGHFFCLLDIEAFMDASLFRKRVDRMIDEIKACRKRPDAQEILVPGERRYRIGRENRERGIPLGEQTIKELEALCEAYEIPFRIEEKKEALC